MPLVDLTEAQMRGLLRAYGDGDEDDGLTFEQGEDLVRRLKAALPPPKARLTPSKRPLRRRDEFDVVGVRR